MIETATQHAALKPRFWGFGPGYSYRGGARSIIAIADSLETVRLSVAVAGSARLRATRPFPANPARSVFILQRQ